MSVAYKVLESQQLCAVSRLFSSSLIRELARKGRSPLFARLANELSSLKLTASHDLVRKLFDQAFALLQRKHYRHGYIYKADSVILNGTSTVYEIKSERDSLKRLKQQISSYRKVFARVNVITGENHLNAVIASVPQDVGILLLTDRFQISTIREPKNSPERTLPESIFDSIQLLEAKKILKKNGFEIPKLPNTKICNMLFQ